MEVIIAKTAGFCFGVDNAVKSVYDHIEKYPLYTFGPIIHNPQVVEDMKNKGVKVINNIDELQKIEEGTVIIRSHGVGKHIYDLVEDKGLALVDATCPYVRRIHEIVRQCSDRGDIIVIIGDSNHPEVIGIKGWSNSKTIIIEDLDDAKKLDLDKNTKVCVVEQTTFNYQKFKEIIEILQRKGYHVDIKKTICSATAKRQQEALELSAKVDKMIVIGGKQSSNTQKLYNICKNQCDQTYHIETIEDMELDVLKPNDIVGITAGASTPKNIIEEVISHVRNAGK